MVAVSFSLKWLELVHGEKRQTIRLRNPERVDAMERNGIQAYWKQRKPEGYKLFDAELTETFPIKFKMLDKGVPTIIKKEDSWRQLPVRKANEIARDDKFHGIVPLYYKLKEMYGDPQEEVFDTIRFREKPTPLLEYEDELFDLIKNKIREKDKEFIERDPVIKISNLMKGVKQIAPIDFAKGHLIQLLRHFEEEDKVRCEPYYTIIKTGEEGWEL